MDLSVHRLLSPQLHIHIQLDINVDFISQFLQKPFQVSLHLHYAFFPEGGGVIALENLAIYGRGRLLCEISWVRLLFFKA